ncbi:hypothetical protein FQN57_006218 [Myotisia sp. PD_48]|nr:hypothetical protein FQN57_006218 [Myotisia sp. PD_48]
MATNFNIPPSNIPDSAAVMKTELSQDPQVNGSNLKLSNWNNERQLVSELWTLQQMDLRIQRLRSLVPERLMAPLKPFIAQSWESGADQVLPGDLFQLLSQAVKDGITELDDFKSSWNSPEMGTILNRVDQRLAQRGGEYPHMNGIWHHSYEAMLKSLEIQGQMLGEEDAIRKENEEKINLQYSNGGWKSILSAFMARDSPGILVQDLSTNDAACFSIILQAISVVFYIQHARNTRSQDAEIWHVNSGIQQNPSKLTIEILECIQSRGKKWDLGYLLEMIASYAEIKTSPCVACKNLIDSSAQLPTKRIPRPLPSLNNTTSYAWDPYHSLCI